MLSCPALLSRVGDFTRFVLVGDPDQLPPVGPGSPLHAAIESGLIPRVGE